MSGRRALERAASIGDLRRLARRRLPRMVFDYIDGAAGNEVTAARNRHALDRVVLRADILHDVSLRETATTVLGQRLAMPVVVGPTGLNGAFWPAGDLSLARAAHAAGVPLVMSTAACVGLEAMHQAAGPLRWFQLYMLKDVGLAKALLDRVAEQGFSVLELTVDTAVGGRRHRDIRNGFTLPFRWTAAHVLDALLHPRWALGMLRSGAPTLELLAETVGRLPKGTTITEVMQQQLNSAMTWHDLAWLREHWKGKLVLKGIASPEHVRRGLDLGIDGVVLSNHGGRQLEGAAATLELLPGIVAAADGRLAVLVDSGFRSGYDVAKAVALGADAVQLGRATLYGLAAAGEAGVRHALDIIRAEFDSAMALCGATTVAGLRGRADWAPVAPGGGVVA